MLQKIVFFWITALLISSCCTTRICKVDRANKKIHELTEKYPELTRQDTIVVKDTIKIESVVADTSFVDPLLFDTIVGNVINKTDTIVVVKDKIKIKYVRQDSIVYLSGECEGDTIYLEKEIPVEKVIIREPTFAEKTKGWTWLLIAIAICGFVARMYLKDITKIFKFFK